MRLQVALQALSVFALQLNEHVRHREHISLRILEGQPQLFSAIHRAVHKRLIGTAGLRSQAAAQLPQHGQLLIDPDIEVIPDAARAFHQVFDSAHFHAEPLAHHCHFACQLLGKLHLTQAVCVAFKVGEHLPHKLRGILRGGFHRKGQGIGHFGHLRQLCRRQTVNRPVNLRRGVDELDGACPISGAEQQRITLDGFQGCAVDTPRGGLVKRIKHFNSRGQCAAHGLRDAPHGQRAHANTFKRIL